MPGPQSPAVGIDIGREGVFVLYFDRGRARAGHGCDRGDAVTAIVVAPEDARGLGVPFAVDEIAVTVPGRGTLFLVRGLPVPLRTSSPVLR